MLNWFDENPDRYWWLVCGMLAWTLFILLRPDWQDVRRTDWGWRVIILAVLIAGRWPAWFVPQELNPDESQFIAGAITLCHDPLFWRSVDGPTSGPVNYYALLPAGWIHGADDFSRPGYRASPDRSCAHQAIALVFGRQVARITGFATLCFESLTTHDDLLHYSSELAPVGLLGCLLLLAVYRCSGKSGEIAGAAAIHSAAPGRDHPIPS
jgi:hypothetical protein